MLSNFMKNNFITKCIDQFIIAIRREIMYNLGFM